MDGGYFYRWPVDEFDGGERGRFDFFSGNRSPRRRAVVGFCDFAGYVAVDWAVYGLDFGGCQNDFAAGCGGFGVGCGTGDDECKVVPTGNDSDAVEVTR